MTLMLHRGAQEIDYPGLRRLDTPPATASHVPIEHFRVVDLVKSTLFMYGHEVTAEHHGVTEDGMRYFGVLSLRSTYTGYEDMVALRNSNDRSFPVSIGFGSRVFCCDNMALVADHVIRRKHTANLKRDLPGIIWELIEPLTLQREAQHRTIERYRNTDIPNALADHAILSMYRRGVINVQRIPDVLEQWEMPAFEEFKERRNAWRLFNAATYSLSGRIVDRPEHNADAARDHRRHVRASALIFLPPPRAAFLCRTAMTCQACGISASPPRSRGPIDAHGFLAHVLSLSLPPGTERTR